MASLRMLSCHSRSLCKNTKCVPIIIGQRCCAVWLWRQLWHSTYLLHNHFVFGLYCLGFVFVFENTFVSLNVIVFVFEYTSVSLNVCCICSQHHSVLLIMTTAANNGLLHHHNTSLSLSNPVLYLNCICLCLCICIHSQQQSAVLLIKSPTVNNSHLHHHYISLSLSHSSVFQFLWIYSVVILVSALECPIIWSYTFRIKAVFVIEIHGRSWS